LGPVNKNAGKTKPAQRRIGRQHVIISGNLEWQHIGGASLERHRRQGGHVNDQQQFVHDLIE
jgi:hypothetical protein